MELGIASAQAEALPESQHMLHIHLAEVAKVVLADQVARRLLHGGNVERPLAVLCHEVLVLTVASAKPAEQSLDQRLTSRARAPHMWCRHPLPSLPVYILTNTV